MPDQSATNGASPADDAERAAQELEALREQVRAKRYALQKAREDGDLDAMAELGRDCNRLVGDYSDLVARVMTSFPGPDAPAARLDAG